VDIGPTGRRETFFDPLTTRSRRTNLIAAMTATPLQSAAEKGNVVGLCAEEGKIFRKNAENVKSVVAF